MDHKVRSQLDELKREELERLRHLATKEHNLMNNLNLEHLKIAEHLDHSNKHTFEIDDLKKLIAKVCFDVHEICKIIRQDVSFENNICYRNILQTRKDLEEKDEQRHEEFKQYEMQKKYEEEQKMKGNTSNQKKT